MFVRNINNFHPILRKDFERFLTDTLRIGYFYLYNIIMKEIFKAIKGYEGIYEISNYGNVKSFQGNKQRILKPQKWSKGYLWVCLSKNDSESKQSVSRLVASAFILNPENKPQVNHINGNKSDNILSNLEWCSQSENMKHAISLGLKKYFKGEKHSAAKLKDKDIISIRKTYGTNNYSQSQIAEIYGVSRSCISNIVSRRNWSHL